MKPAKATLQRGPGKDPTWNRYYCDSVLSVVQDCIIYKVIALVIIAIGTNKHNHHAYNIKLKSTFN